MPSLASSSRRTETKVATDARLATLQYRDVAGSATQWRRAAIAREIRSATRGIVPWAMWICMDELIIRIIAAGALTNTGAASAHRTHSSKSVERRRVRIQNSRLQNTVDYISKF